MNEQNLRPFRAGEQRARDAGRRGGIASGKARQERRERIQRIWAMFDASNREQTADEQRDSEP